MSIRMEVAAAVRALVKAALPGADVNSNDDNETKPERVGDAGMAIIGSGDRGTPDIDLSPVTYWWDHAFPVALAAYRTETETAQQVLDRMLVAIGEAIVADRFLGGLCTYLDATAPTDGETDTRGAKALGWADFTIVATYSTTSPLG